MSIRKSLIVAIGIAAMVMTASFPVVAKNRKGATAQPFIVETRISAPKRVGEFQLESSYYDPDTKHAGASFRYALLDHPQIRFDLFVYPAGDMPQDTAMTSGMKHFVDSFDAGVKMNYYNDLKIVDTVVFEIEPETEVETEVSSTDEEKPAISAEPEDEAAVKRAAIIKAVTPKPVSGKRIDLQYNITMEGTGETVPMRSRGYLFYKQLYYFKGRISVAETRMDQTTFESLSNRAMRELVPAVQVTNIGGCANAEIAMNKEDLAEGNDQIGMMILKMLSQAVDRNCHATRAEAKKTEPANAEIVTIEYDPDDWSSQ